MSAPPTVPAVTRYANLKILRYGDILREPLPAMVWDVEPLIGRGSRVLINAEYGAFKTWLGLHLALHLAAGQPWLDTFPIATPRAVLYVDEEMPERTLRRRVWRLGHGAGLGEFGLPLVLLNRQGIRVDAGGAEALLTALARDNFKPEVVVLDTYRRVAPGDENEAKDVGAFWYHAKPLTEGETTLVVIHHMRKPRSKSEALRHRASGSTDLAAAVDAKFDIARLGKNVVRVEHDKSRDGEEAAAFTIALDDGGSRDAPIVLRYVGTTPPTDAAKQDQAERAVVEFLRTCPDRQATSADIGRAVAAHGLSDRTIERALTALKRATSGPRLVKEGPPTGQGPLRLVEEEEAPADAA